MRSGALALIALALLLALPAAGSAGTAPSGPPEAAAAAKGKKSRCAGLRKRSARRACVRRARCLRRSARLRSARARRKARSRCRRRATARRKAEARRGPAAPAPRRSAPRKPSPPPAAEEPSTPLGRYLSVSTREFSLTLSRPALAAGAVTIELRNVGEDPHNLVLSPDASHTVIAAFEETGPGGVEAKGLQLHAGRYRLWCSLEGHEALGMSARLRVE